MILCNTFGVKAFPGLHTQGARLRRDLGLWNVTPSA